MPFLSRCGHYTGYHRVGDGTESEDLSTSYRHPENYLTSDSRPIDRHSRTIRHRGSPLNSLVGTRQHVPVFPHSEPPAIGFRRRGGMCDSTHLTELGRNAVRKLAHVFRTSHGGGKYRMGFGGLLLRCFCDLARSRIPLFLPPPRGKRPARPLPLAAVSRWPPWGSRGLQRWWWMISSPLPRASWYA